ncbi:hypothetical protein Sj15T_22270 [Sphingobium sp. TA15]|nr:hypothetical protein Sj15T_22270 [Sphingobium sp. TA15]
MPSRTLQVRTAQIGIPQVAALEVPAAEVEPGQVGLFQVAIDKMAASRGAELLNIVTRQRSAAQHMLGGKVVHRSLLNPKWSLFHNRLVVRPAPEC